MSFHILVQMFSILHSRENKFCTRVIRQVTNPTDASRPRGNWQLAPLTLTMTTNAHRKLRIAFIHPDLGIGKPSVCS